LKIPEGAIPEMAKSASANTRLLSVNPRTITAQDIESIYRKCL
jgi:alcohol dehydrogenase class IV